MSFVPHQDRHALHGITVVLETDGTTTFVGRLDTADERGIWLKDVGVHDASVGGLSKADYLRQTIRYGIRKDQEAVLVENPRVLSLQPLTELSLD
ncbi:MAG: hypothetical protein ACREMO_04650 [Gemmatimonadales bacterium]